MKALRERLKTFIMGVLQMQPSVPASAPVEEHDAVAHMMRAHRATHGPAPVELKSLRKLAKVHGVAETKLADELRKRGAQQKLFVDLETGKGTRLWKLFPDERDV